MTRILIVDDDPSIRKAYVAMCTQQKWEFATAENGYEGLVKLKTDKPDLILLDVLMPRMSGLDFLKEARRHDYHIPPTIVMTNSQVPKDTGQTAKTLGAVAYRVKATTKLSELVKMIKEHIGA